MIDDPRRIIKRTRSYSSATEGDRERRPRPKGVACERSEWGSGPGRKGCVYTGNIYINSPFFIVPHDRIIIFCQYIFCVLTSYFHTLPCNKPIQRQNAPSPVTDGLAPSQPVQQTTRKGAVCNRSLFGSSGDCKTIPLRRRRPAGRPRPLRRSAGRPGACPRRVLTPARRSLSAQPISRNDISTWAFLSACVFSYPFSDIISRSFSRSSAFFFSSTSFSFLLRYASK